ncbi:MAG: ribonuclease HII [Candidatus Sumerlaeota bacterium]|nr:ribonuclease HII [Candidatus Sumerlaeota bacterium]
MSSSDLYEFDRQFFSEGVRLLCGLDEAGRGPLAGPVVAAAAVFAKGVSIPGVADSKTLSAERREELYDVILTKAVEVRVGIVGPGTIDRINILAATHKAAKAALSRLVAKPDLIITDYLNLKRVQAPLKFFVRGDAISHAIAAASMIAKVTRDRLMMEYHERFPQYNFARNKGYGTREHMEALAKSGPCEIHRLTFKGVTGRDIF